MPTSSRGIVKNTIQTSSVTAGLLNAEQAKQFLKMTFETSDLSKRVRHIIKTAKAGEIDKIGINSRLLRKKIEDTDDNYRAKPKFGKIEYSTKSVRLPWEITEETLRENIEGQSLEAVITNLMTTQIGLDKTDLELNGDEKLSSAAEFSDATIYAVGDFVTKDGKLYVFTAAHNASAWSTADVEEVGVEEDADFLGINDGWIKQITDGGHVYDNQNQALTLDMFYMMSQMIAQKYHKGLEWIMHPIVAQNWERTLYNACKANGSTAPDKMYTAPAGHIITPEIMMPVDKILIVNPQNLIDVNTYDVKVRKTTEGKEAIMQDKRFYVSHFDFDAIIEEVDACGIITNVNSIL